MPKLCPKVILEGTRLTLKTDIAFALNEHPRVVGPRKYRYHSPHHLGGVVWVHERPVGTRPHQLRAAGRRHSSRDVPHVGAAD